MLYRSAPPTFMTNASIPSVLAAVSPDDAGLLRFLPFIAILVCAIWLGTKKRQWPPTVVSLCLLPIACTLSPFTWGHDYLLCLPFLYLCGYSAQALRSQRSIWSGPLITLLALQATIPLALAYHFFVPGWSFVVCGIIFLAMLYVLIRSKILCRFEA